MITFGLIPLGTEFMSGGTRYRKRSSRTAANLDYGGWYYFRKHERILLSAEKGMQS